MWWLMGWWQDSGHSLWGRIHAYHNRPWKREELHSIIVINWIAYKSCQPFSTFNIERWRTRPRSRLRPATTNARNGKVQYAINNFNTNLNMHDVLLHTRKCRPTLSVGVDSCKPPETISPSEMWQWEIAAHSDDSGDSHSLPLHHI